MPLIDLVAITLPGFGPIVVATIAAIVVIGVLNAYLPAFANLGASLGRDGAPAALVRARRRGRAPFRAARSRCSPCSSLVYIAVFFVFHLDLQTFILIHTSSMVAVYAVGMVAAVRLLRVGQRGLVDGGDLGRAGGRPAGAGRMAPDRPRCARRGRRRGDRRPKGALLVVSARIRPSGAAVSSISATPSVRASSPTRDCPRRCSRRT